MSSQRTSRPHAHFRIGIRHKPKAKSNMTLLMGTSTFQNGRRAAMLTIGVEKNQWTRLASWLPGHLARGVRKVDNTIQRKAWFVYTYLLDSDLSGG